MTKRYGFTGAVYLLYCFLRTKLLFHNARIIRFPIDIRNKRGMRISKGFTTGKYCRLEVENAENDLVRLSIGENVQFNDFCHITAAEKVVIGKNVLLASKVYISDVSHGAYGMKDIHSNPNEIPKDRPLVTSGVIIHDNVWLGDGVCVLPGVTIGRGSIIGANAVVNRDISAYTIAVGIPAKPVKRFNFDNNKWERIIE